MKVTCIREKLLEGVESASRVSGRNLTLPVLNCIRIEAGGSLLTLRATNLEVGVEVTLPAQVKEPGVVAVSGQVLLGTIGTMSNEKVELELKEGNLLVKTPHGDTLLKAHPSEDFPSLPQGKDGDVVTLPAEIIVRGVRSVMYSASTSSIKPEQASVYIFPERNRLYFVATDSFRLAEKNIEFKHELTEFEPILIPIKNVLEALRLLESCEDNVEMRVTRNQISFSFGSTYFTSRLIDGNFPNYREVIPKESVTEAIVLKQDLVQLFKKASLFAGNTNQVAFHINPQEKKFTLEARSADVGESKDAISATLKGEPLDIHFNHHYIADCFPALTTDSVALMFSGLGRPLIMRSVSDASFLYLVMPMNK